MTFKEINKFARDNGYIRAERAFTWHDMDVYEPIMTEEEDGITFTGPPWVILVSEDSIKMSTYEESMTILEYGIKKGFYE